MWSVLIDAFYVVWEGVFSSCARHGVIISDVAERKTSQESAGRDGQIAMDVQIWR